MITTEAWVLRRSSRAGESALEGGDFRKAHISIPDLADDELLVEPLYGAWEGNMSHALSRRPIDVCRQRGEENVVLGNSGVLRVLRVGAAVRGVREGDVGSLFGAGETDAYGYTVKAFAYDAPGTIGLLAKRTKVRAHAFVPLPPSAYSLAQWAAHSARYATAWSNWRVAHGAYRLQVSEAEDRAPHVWGWGGGTTFAELDLARRMGCRVAMLSGSDDRLEALRAAGITAVDRRRFPDIALDEERYRADPEYKRRYLASERDLLDEVMARTEGRGAAIFAEYIGAPVMRVTLKALAREGVLATAGWLLGMNTSTLRAVECIHRRIHVHTHHARRTDLVEAIDYSVATGWMPEVSEVYDWDDVPALARAAADNTTRTFFPVYRVNAS